MRAVEPDGAEGLPPVVVKWLAWIGAALLLSFGGWAITKVDELRTRIQLLEAHQVRQDERLRASEVTAHVLQQEIQTRNEWRLHVERDLATLQAQRTYGAASVNALASHVFNINERVNTLLPDRRHYMELPPPKEEERP